MKVTVNEDNNLQVENVFNPLVLRTNDGEVMILQMRDSGFEFEYEGKMYSAKNGIVESINKK